MVQKTIGGLSKYGFYAVAPQSRIKEQVVDYVDFISQPYKIKLDILLMLTGGEGVYPIIPQKSHYVSNSRFDPLVELRQFRHSHTLHFKLTHYRVVRDT